MFGDVYFGDAGRVQRTKPELAGEGKCDFEMFSAVFLATPCAADPWRVLINDELMMFCDSRGLD